MGWFCASGFVGPITIENESLLGHSAAVSSRLGHLLIIGLKPGEALFCRVAMWPIKKKKKKRDLTLQINIILLKYHIEYCRSPCNLELFQLHTYDRV